MKCMLEITIAPEVIAKFKELLVEEDNEDAVFRIRASTNVKIPMRNRKSKLKAYPSSSTKT